MLLAMTNSARLVMTNGGYITLLLVMLSSCNLFKKVHSETVRDQRNSKVLDEVQLTASRSMQTNQHFLEWRIDSMNKNDVAMIWPKGKFTFSALAGFEGEAERILIASSLSQSENALKTQDSLVSEENQIKTGWLHKSSDWSQSTIKTKTQSPAFWLTIAVFFILMTGLIIYKLLNKRI